MAISARLPDDQNVVRYVGGSHIDEITGVINGSAFDRTVKDVDGLSVTRRLFLDSDDTRDQQAIRDVIGSRLFLGKTAVFAEVNVGQVRSLPQASSLGIELEEDPLPAEGLRLANPAHALILGLPIKGESVGSLRSEVLNDQLARLIEHRFQARV
jgi:hypothetical protein